MQSENFEKKIQNPTYYCGDFGYNSHSLAKLNLQIKHIIKMQWLMKNQSFSLP